MKRKILMTIATILFFSVGTLRAQSIKKMVGYLNAKGDSLRFSICKSIIDTLMTDKKVDKIIIRYDGSSDYYEINEENIRAINYVKVKADSFVVADFDKSLRLKFKAVQQVSIDSIGSQGGSFLEEFYFFGRSANTIYIILQNPLETWEPLKLPLYYFATKGFTNSRFNYVIRNVLSKLSIPVRVIYNHENTPSVNCYMFNYEIILDEKNKLPEWKFKNKVLLY